MNLPTVGCSPPALRALSSTVACEPVTATTRPIRSGPERASAGADCVICDGAVDVSMRTPARLILQFLRDGRAGHGNITGRSPFC